MGHSALWKPRSVPQLCGYFFWLQQSPGQQAPLAQQLAPQQLPAQHFAPGVQQDALVRARADRENSDVANKASTLAFMEILLSV